VCPWPYVVEGKFLCLRSNLDIKHHTPRQLFFRSET
jgi:hypothetical protein